jgi:hypothetical protein
MKIKCGLFPDANKGILCVSGKTILFVKHDVFIRKLIKAMTKYLISLCRDLTPSECRMWTELVPVDQVYQGVTKSVTYHATWAVLTSLLESPCNVTTIFLLMLRWQTYYFPLTLWVGPSGLPHFTVSSTYWSFSTREGQIDIIYWERKSTKPTNEFSSFVLQIR